MMQKHDLLYAILKKHLDLIDPNKESLQDLVYEVVGEYMAELMAIGNIPHYLLDLVESDLREEVLDMYRKTTYGFLTLKDFKEGLTAKKKRHKSKAS